MDAKNRKKTRIAKRCTIDLTTSAAAEVERMQEIFDLSVADVFRHSLWLMSTYADAISAGREFASIGPGDPNDRQVIKLPIFNNVAKDARSIKAKKEAKLSEGKAV